MDSEQFRNTVMPLQKVMFRVALHIMGNADDACDAIQDTLEKLWIKRSSLSCVENASAYCIGVLKNQCLTMLRQTRVTDSTDKLPDHTDSTDLFSQVEARDNIDRIRRIIASLPETQRRVAELSIFSQCSNTEICSITGMTDQNVRANLSRARHRIKELFTEKI